MCPAAGAQAFPTPPRPPTPHPSVPLPCVIRVSAAWRAGGTGSEGTADAEAAGGENRLLPALPRGRRGLPRAHGRPVRHGKSRKAPPKRSCRGGAGGGKMIRIYQATPFGDDAVRYLSKTKDALSLFGLVHACMQALRACSSLSLSHVRCEEEKKKGLEIGRPPTSEAKFEQ